MQFFKTFSAYTLYTFSDENQRDKKNNNGPRVFRQINFFFFKDTIECLILVQKKKKKCVKGQTIINVIMARSCIFKSKITLKSVMPSFVGACDILYYSKKNTNLIIMLQKKKRKRNNNNASLLFLHCPRLTFIFV